MNGNFHRQDLTSPNGSLAQICDRGDLGTTRETYFCFFFGGVLEVGGVGWGDGDGGRRAGTEVGGWIPSLVTPVRMAGRDGCGMESDHSASKDELRGFSLIDTHVLQYTGQQVKRYSMHP